MKMNHSLWFLCLATALIAVPAFAQEAKAKKAKEGGGKGGYTESIEGATAHVYKTVGDVKLKLHVFNPPDFKAGDKRPTIVFFFGGGWTSGSPTQFQNQCRYLAAQGMVAITADYRVASRHNVKAVQCVADAKSAVRWVRANAAKLGIDPKRIAAGGGSAGGHLAACTGVISGLDEAGEDTSVSSVPNAMVLFNPALVLAPMEGAGARQLDPALNERFGTEPKNISPAHHVKAGAPPAIIFHGKDDTTVPYATAEAFDKAMKGAGNRCELAGYEGQAHGFFNFGRAGNQNFASTLAKAHEFLASLGWIKGGPKVSEFFKDQIGQ